MSCRTRELYGRRFNFAPTHKVLLVTNHRPKIRGTDNAIWRRVRLVPFNVTIPPNRQDANLRSDLVGKHGSAVLTWLVKGAIAWHSDGLGSAEAVDVATADYKSSQDQFSAFFDENMMEAKTKTKVGDLYDLWRGWCERNGERPGRKQDFSAALSERGFNTEKYQGVHYVINLGIRCDGGSQWVLSVSFPKISLVGNFTDERS